MYNFSIVLYSSVFSFSVGKGAAAKTSTTGHFIKKNKQKKEVKRRVYLYKKLLINGL